MKRCPALVNRSMLRSIRLRTRSTRHPTGRVTAGRCIIEPAALSASSTTEQGGAEPSLLDVDPMLMEILSSEVEAHLCTIRAYLDATQAAGPIAVTEELLRAVHTLNGALSMVDLPVLTRVVAPLEGYLKRLRARGMEPTAEGLDTLHEASACIASVMVALETKVPAPDTTELADRVLALRDDLPAPDHPFHGFGIHVADEARDEDAASGLHHDLEPGAALVEPRPWYEAEEEISTTVELTEVFDASDEPQALGEGHEAGEVTASAELMQTTEHQSSLDSGTGELPGVVVEESLSNSDAANLDSVAQTLDLDDLLAVDETFSTPRPSRWSRMRTSSPVTNNPRVRHPGSRPIYPRPRNCIWQKVAPSKLRQLNPWTPMKRNGRARAPTTAWCSMSTCPTCGHRTLKRTLSWSRNSKPRGPTLSRISCRSPSPRRRSISNSTFSCRPCRRWQRGIDPFGRDLGRSWRNQRRFRGLGRDRRGSAENAETGAAAELVEESEASDLVVADLGEEVGALGESDLVEAAEAFEEAGLAEKAEALEEAEVVEEAETLGEAGVVEEAEGLEAAEVVETVGTVETVEHAELFGEAATVKEKTPPQRAPGSRGARRGLVRRSDGDRRRRVPVCAVRCSRSLGIDDRRRPPAQGRARGRIDR